MTEGNKTISNDDEQCRVFNNFFSKTVHEPKIPNISNYKLDNTNDPLKEALKYFENYPSITNIKIKVLMQILPLEMLVPVKLLNLSKP